MDAAGEEVWILGGGRFGRQAAATLRKKMPAAAITVVDKEVIAGLPAGIDSVQDDGVDWLVDHLEEETGAVKIVPAIPVHLLAEWLKRNLAAAGRVVQPVAIADDLLKNFPNPCRLSPSQLAVSHADFLCPPACVEPEGVCTFTQQPRPAPLYEVLQKQPCGKFTPLITRSRQFGSGVGGYHPADLRQLLKKVITLPETPLLIGTACKCHGIVDGLMVR